MLHKTTSFLYYFVRWVIMSVIITMIFGTIYLAVQQNYRLSAYDPQIQISEDLADALASGLPIDNVKNNLNTMDIAKSLNTFIMVFDDTGASVASSALLNNTTPSLSAGIFSYAKKNGQDKLTWQPQKGVRHAIVLTHYKTATSGGFVLVGRSLREIEMRESLLNLQVGLPWLAVIVFTFLIAVLMYLLSKGKGENKSSTL